MAAGAIGYAAGLALSGGEGSGSRIDPRGLAEPWAGLVREALDAQLRYQRALGHEGVDPRIRERLTGLGERVDTAVAGCWRVAVQGDNLERVLADLEPASDLRLRLATLERIGTASGADAGVAESLRGQLQSIERIMAVREDLRGRLGALDAELDRVVARTVELSFGEDEHGELVELERRMDHLVTDMEALRRVVDHTQDSRPAE